MGHAFQVVWWGKHPSECSFGLLWVRKLVKTMAKHLEMQEALIGILFMKIITIRTKGR